MKLAYVAKSLHQVAQLELEYLTSRVVPMEAKNAQLARRGAET